MSKLKVLRDQLSKMRKNKVTLRVIPLLETTMNRAVLKGTSTRILNALIVWQDIQKGELCIGDELVVSLEDIAETEADVDELIESTLSLQDQNQRIYENVDEETFDGSDTKKINEVLVISMLRAEWNTLLFKDEELDYKTNLKKYKSTRGLLVSYDYVACVNLNGKAQTDNVIRILDDDVSIMNIIRSSFERGDLFFSENDIGNTETTIFEISDTRELYQPCKTLEENSNTETCYIKCDKYIFNEAINSDNYAKKKTFDGTEELFATHKYVYIPLRRKVSE